MAWETKSSRSSAYAILAYQMAKLKTYYPKEFMVSLLNSVITEREDIAVYVNECLSMGIDVLPPDINKSDALFKIENESIRFGLIGVKAVGQPTYDIIEDARELQEAFTSYDDKDSKRKTFKTMTEFYMLFKNHIEEIHKNDENFELTDESSSYLIDMIPKDAMINLIKSGAFGMNRNEILKEFAELLYEPLKYKERKTLPMRGDFKKLNLEISEEDYKDKSKRHQIFIEYKYQEHIKKDSVRKQKHINEFSSQYVRNEKFYDFDVMGCYISASPFDSFKNKLKDFYEYNDGDSKIIIMGTILKKEVKKSGRGGQYAKISIVSPFGVYQGKCFSANYIEYKDAIEKGETVVMLVKRSKDEFIISKLQSFKEWKDAIMLKRQQKKKREERLSKNDN